MQKFALFVAASSTLVLTSASAQNPPFYSPRRLSLAVAFSYYFNPWIGAFGQSGWGPRINFRSNVD